MESNLPFNLLIHKISDVFSNENDEKLLELKTFLLKHNCLVIDPFESVEKIFSRIESEKLLERCGANVPKSNSNMEDWNIFPSIIKPNKTVFNPQSHQMKVIHSPLDVPQERMFIQELIPHDGRLFKVYAIGCNFDVVCRNSISLSTQSAFEFNSQNLSKQNIPFIKSCIDFDKIAEIVQRIVLDCVLNFSYQ